jgi:hypothetical protein
VLRATSATSLFHSQCQKNNHIGDQMRKNLLQQIPYSLLFFLFGLKTSLHPLYRGDLSSIPYLWDPLKKMLRSHQHIDKPSPPASRSRRRRARPRLESKPSRSHPRRRQTRPPADNRHHLSSRPAATDTHASLPVSIRGDKRNQESAPHSGHQQSINQIDYQTGQRLILFRDELE